MHTAWKRVVPGAAALAIALGTTLTLPVAAQAATAAPATSGTVAFAVFDTGAGIPRGRSFQLNDLANYGIPRQTVETLAAGEKADEKAPTALAAPPADRFDIVGEWKDRDGGSVVMRKGWWDGGNAGFGMTKIDQKHNLSLAAVKATTMYPRPGPTGKEQIGPTTYNWRTDVLHVECSGWWIFRTCEVTEVKSVLAGIDYRKLGDGKSFGAVTAFCEGVQGRCPGWVRNAINI